MRWLPFFLMACANPRGIGPTSSVAGSETPVAVALTSEDGRGDPRLSDPGPPSESASEADASSGNAASVEVRPDAGAPPPDGPLSQDARQLLAALPNEHIPAPREFYYRSNERRHDLVAAPLAGLGGAIVGVGADQLYTLSAYARSVLVVAVDYDQRVALVHDLYQVLVPRSETPAQLIAHFDPEREAATIALLIDAYDGSRERRLVRIYRRIRAQMRDYLQRQTRRLREGRPGSWLADAALYDHVRELFLQGRVLARTGDLTGTTTLRQIGATLRRLGLVVRVLYFSNAEQFFVYTPDFRQNMLALPTDARTVVVRTTRHRSLPNAAGDRWHYIVQDFTDFAERLEAGVYGRSTVMLEDLAEAGAPFVGEGASRMTTEVPRLLLERRRARLR